MDLISPTYSAGIAAIVKCVQLPNLGSPDTCKPCIFTLHPDHCVEANRLLDVNAGLFILDITESVVTIVAACIPSLRVLIREVRPSSNTQSSHVTCSFDVSEGGKYSFKEVEAREKPISNGSSSKESSNC